MAGKVSIVTTVLNRHDMIADAVESVRTQNHANLEHIVIDGGSTDGTLELLRSYSHLHLISTADEGPEDAINKGLRLASGEIIGFLMSDDILAANILSEIVSLFDVDPELDIVSCGAGFFSDQEGGRGRAPDKICGVENIHLTPRNILLGAPIACARFYRRRVFEKAGEIGTTYQFCNDRDFLLRAILAGCQNRCLDRISYWYRIHESSHSLFPDRAKKRALAVDHLMLAENYLASPGIENDLRRWLYRFHSVECARLIYHALADVSFGTVVSTFIRGFRRNAGWPMVFAMQIPTVLRLRKRFRLAPAEEAPCPPLEKR